MNDLTQQQSATWTDQEPFLHGDDDGNMLAIHAGSADSDLNPCVAIEVDQIGHGTSTVRIRNTNVVRVAADLCAAAGLPAHSMRSAALFEAARVADALDATAVAAELRRLAADD